MNATKPFLILQLRPEDDTSDSEFEAILKYGELEAQHAHRLRIEKTGIPELALEDYAAVIVGGSPFDISSRSRPTSGVSSMKSSARISRFSVPARAAACWVPTWIPRYRPATRNRWAAPGLN
jgi:hypothetical protein